MSAKRYDIEYGESALEDLEDLPAKQRAQILRKIEDYGMASTET